MLRQSLPQGFRAHFSSCGNYLCAEGGMVHPTRTLDTFVLLVGIDGEIAISQDGLCRTLTPDTALLLFPGVEHRGAAPCSPGVSYYWCHFTLSGTDAQTDPEPTDGARLLTDFCHLPHPGRIKQLFRYLLDAAARGSAREEICGHILELLLLELATQGDITEAGRKGSAEAKRVLEWLRLYYKTVSSVEQIAAQFGYNKEYLTTLVRHVTGKPLSAHLTELRISEAESLLLCSELPIREIASAIGYSDEKYFSRVFRKKTDLTPTQYRYLNQKKHCNRK